MSSGVTDDSIGRPTDPDSSAAAVEEDQPTRTIDRQIRTVLEWVAVAVGALAVALIIKTFLLQAFYIPSGSMEETLRRGDRVLVNKLSYDLHDVNRGDVIVFGKPPGEGGEIDDLIKRVIALPGETVTFQGGMIFIDGLLLDEPYIEADVPSLAKTPIPNCVNPPVTDSCTVPDDRVKGDALSNWQARQHADAGCTWGQAVNACRNLLFEQSGVVFRQYRRESASDRDQVLRHVDHG